METEIAAKWKRTFILPLRLCTTLEKMEKGRTSRVTENEEKGRRRALKRVEEERSENYKGLCCISRRWVTLEVRTVWIFRSNRKSFVCSHWGVGSFSKGQKKEIGQFGKQGLVLRNAYQGHCGLTPRLNTCVSDMQAGFLLQSRSTAVG